MLSASRRLLEGESGSNPLGLTLQTPIVQFLIAVGAIIFATPMIVYAGATPCLGLTRAVSTRWGLLSAVETASACTLNCLLSLSSPATLADSADCRNPCFCC
jgi:hypothetical protein